MSDRIASFELGEGISFENLWNQPHLTMGVKSTPIGGDDSGTLLATMLEGVKPVVGDFCRVGMVEYAEHAAVMLGEFLDAFHLPQACRIGACFVKCLVGQCDI